MSETLDLSNVINVTIQPTPQNLGVQNINAVALISSEEPDWYGAEDYRIYTNATEVATDFGSDSEAADIAAAFFSQNPNPLTTGGYLAIIPLQAGPETVQAAILRTIDTVYYFGVLIDSELDVDDATAFSNLATYIQTLDKMFVYCSSEANDLNPGSPLDLVRSAGKTHTRCLYYGTQDTDPIEPWVFAAAYAGRAFSTDFAGSNTTTTLHLKQLATIATDQTVNQTALGKAQTAGIDVYVNVGVPGIFTSGENVFFDEIYNEFWLKFALQTAGFNYLAGSRTKIPQTEAGMEGLKNVYRGVCAQGVSNGFLAPGSWTSPDVFGNPANLIRSILDIGFYVYSKPISQQSQVDREARLAPLIQIAVKAAGAIHKSNVIVNVNL